MRRRRQRRPRSTELFYQMVEARDPVERARIERELYDLLEAETLARHGPPDPNGTIGVEKGRFPIEVTTVGHTFPDGTSIRYDEPLLKPMSMLPSASAYPPVRSVRVPWVFHLPRRQDDA